MKKELIANIASDLSQKALRVSTGRIAGNYNMDGVVFEGPKVSIKAVPRSKWAVRVDNIESPFAPSYDEEEYGANPSLAMMSMFEIRNMLKAFGVKPARQTNYHQNPLEDRNFIVVGTGPGREVIALASLGASVTGFDATKEYVDITAQKVEQASNTLGTKLSVTLCQCPAELYPYEVAAYDGATSLFGVLNHVEDWQNTIEKISESLKPEGKFIFSMYGGNNAIVFRMLANGDLQYTPAILQRRAKGGILLGESQEVLPAKFPPPLEIVETLSKVGLVVDEERGYLRIAALFPKNPTPENLKKFSQIAGTIDPAAAEMISGYAKPEEILLAAFLYDRRNQNNVDDFAYISYVARKK